jgi:hypothetical protein
MLKTTLSVFLLVAFWGSSPAFAHGYRCDRLTVSCAQLPPYAAGVATWGSALPYAEPHDPSGNIILEGAAGAGAPEGDWGPY